MQKSGKSVMAWNVFKFCTALRALGSIMIVLVLGIIGVTYYVIVVANYGPALFHDGLDSFVAFLVLVLFHSLVSSTVLSFF
jgi:palmitoyltransferase